MSIPKKIHYLWLSDKKEPAVERCLKTWKSCLDEYEIIEWNKSNFPYDEFLFTREAFSKKKWAFVTDYFRLWVLEKHGGIYLDADVIVNENFDQFLQNELFIGTELADRLEAHAIGAEPHHPFIQKCLEYYKDRHFILADGSCDLNAIPCIITKIFMEMYSYKGALVNFDGSPLKFSNIMVYPDSYFNINICDGHNVCVHNALGSWRDIGAGNSIAEKMLSIYFWKKFFRKDVLRFTGIKKIFYLLMPVWIIVLFTKYRSKIKNIKNVAKIKITH